MVFSSPIFLFFFLPVVFGLYFLVPQRFKNLILLLFSLLFYTWGEKLIVLVMIASTIIDFFCGIWIEKGAKRAGLWLSVLANVGLLGFFKYTEFAFENLHSLCMILKLPTQWIHVVPDIVLPLGISFYTFQTMSYTIDVYRGYIKANRNYLNFATYVTMFPQLVAGPIVRYRDIEQQLTSRNSSWNDVSKGVQRFIIGLAKKVLIANSFATIADDVFAIQPEQLSTPWAWMGIIAYAFQIYYDFSGYSDMAIGLGRIFGFRFLENFNYPYISQSIQDFWRRWHISLSSWFRDYLYISLGGNRKGKNRTYLNLFIVFFITGLWHGASWNFIIWGLFHGFFLVLERLGLASVLSKVPRIVRHLYTLLIVLIGWVIFRSEDTLYSLEYINRMFVWTDAPGNATVYLNAMYMHAESIIMLLIAVIFSMPMFAIIHPMITLSDAHLKKSFGAMIFHFGIFILCVCYLAAGSYNPFIYFRF